MAACVNDGIEAADILPIFANRKVPDNNVFMKAAGLLHKQILYHNITHITAIGFLIPYACVCKDKALGFNHMGKSVDKGQFPEKYFSQLPAESSHICLFVYALTDTLCHFMQNAVWTIQQDVLQKFQTGIIEHIAAYHITVSNHGMYVRVSGKLHDIIQCSQIIGSLLQ